MKHDNNNNRETIPETLQKCGIYYAFTREELNKIAQEELLRHQIREQINNPEKSDSEGISATILKGMSGLITGPILLFIGLTMRGTFLNGCGLFLIFGGALCFLLSIGIIVMGIIGGLLALFSKITK